MGYVENICFYITKSYLLYFIKSNQKTLKKLLNKAKLLLTIDIVS